MQQMPTPWPRYEDLTEGCITTFTGRQIDPFAMTPDQVDIRDIAHSLANSNRWIGHTRRPISVAEHSLLGAQLIAEPFQLEFLLHDAPEAYLPDLPRPLKQRPEFAFYREAEATIWDAIATAFALPRDHSLAVQETDAVMARAEYEVLMAGFVSDISPFSGSWFSDVVLFTVPAPHRQLRAGEGKAYELDFLETFYRLIFERDQRRRMGATPVSQ